MNTHRFSNKRICSGNRTTRTNSIRSSWIKSLALFRPRVNPITFFDSRLLAGTHTPDYPPIIPFEGDSRCSWHHDGTDGPAPKSREVDSKLRVAGGCSGPYACNYRNVRDDNEESDFRPPVATNYSRGVRRNVGGSPTLCNDKIVTSFWPLYGSRSSHRLCGQSRSLRRW